MPNPSDTDTSIPSRSKQRALEEIERAESAEHLFAQRLLLKQLPQEFRPGHFGTSPSTAEES